MGQRRGAPVLGAALLLVVSLLLPPTTFVGSGTVAAAAPCSLVPQLRAVTLNQGVGSYATLARGKETLVRLYLSLPSCAASTASIALTGGTLTVFNGSTTLGTISAPTPVPSQTAPPLMAPYASAPALDSTADPKFVVPGSVLAPAATTGQFTATFKATVRYAAKSSKSATPVTGSATFTTLTGSTAPITAVVQPRTNALRILVVPMGDASRSYASQFSAAATTAVQNAVTTMSRTLPVPAGVADLGATSGGIRYTINPTLLDIKAYMTNGKFCGGGDNFDAIKGLLAQYLQSWNTANPARTADIVLGVVDSAISLGSKDGCDEGMASVGAPQGWIRAIPDQTGVPSISGALASHETGHTQGTVPLTRDDPFSLYHSPNIAADGSAPGRGYNVTLRSYLAAPRTVMTLSSGWDNTTTLYEPADYAKFLCVLGGLTTQDCATKGSVGTSTGVGAGPRFVISGTTDGTAGGTDVVESYFSIDVAPTLPDQASSIRLLQLKGTQQLSDLGVPTSATLTADAIPAPVSTIPSDRLLFSASFAFDTSATTIRLVKRAGGADTVLYERARNPGGAPTVVSVDAVALDAQDFTNSPVDDADPSLSFDGEWVAWTVPCPDAGVACPATGSPRRIFIAPVNKLANAQAVEVAPGDEAADFFDPALYGGATFGQLKLAFARGTPGPDPTPSDLYSAVVGVVLDDEGGLIPGVPVSAQRLFPLAWPGLARDVSEPTWSPDGGRIAFTGTELGADGSADIFVTEDVGHEEPAPTPEPLAVAPLTGSGDAVSPSWSRTPGVDRIAFNRLDACPDPSVYYCVWTIDPTAPDPSSTAAWFLDDARSPDFGSTGDIYFQDMAPGTAGTYGIARAAWDGGTAGPRIAVTTDTIDETPSTAGPLVAFARAAFGEGPRDIWILGAGAQLVTATATVPAGTDPAEVRADVLLTCGAGGTGTQYLVAVAVAPVAWAGDATRGGTATFDQRFDPTLACAGGTITVLVSDGFLRSAAGPSSSTTVGSDQKPPVAAIYGPPDGSSRLQWNVITLRGSGKDPEDGELTGSSLAWTVSGPNGLTRTATGVAADLPVPADGWPPGDYTAELTVTDATGLTHTIATAFTILGDADNDGIPASVDTSLCGGGTNLDDDPSNAYGDLDGDGLANLSDPEPCVPATDYLATVTFNPQALYLPSNGNSVTMYASIAGRDMRVVTGSSIQLDRVAGEKPYDPSKPSCTVDLGATAYTATASLGTIKFDRQKLAGFLACMGIAHRTIEIRITGAAPPSGSLPAWTFSGIAYANVK